MKKLRGKELDKRLELELQKMIELGHKLSPISRSTLQRRLNLSSRGTLALKHRAMMIENAKQIQLEKAGITQKGEKRKTLKEQNEVLKQEIIELKKERDLLIEKIAMIINGAQARGYDIEEIMLPIINL
jgi:mRNA degradation ribonuclease J1/J2